MNYNLGSYIAGTGIIVGILAHFGIGLDATQVAQTIKDGAVFFSDLAVIYGVLHQFFTTKKVVAAGRVAGYIA